MSLDAGEQAAIIGVGATVLLAAVGAVFKASSLRGDINNKWTRRVSLAVAGLDDKALSELRRLRDDVEGTLADRFDPAQALADPAPLSRRAETTVKFHKARTQMQRDFRHLLQICPILLGGLGAVVVAAPALTVYYAELWQPAALRIGGLILAGLAILVLVVIGIVYAVLQHRLASAEILAGTGGLTDPGGGP